MILNRDMDSTGLKIYGDGVWKVRSHAPSKRRKWRKLHLGVKLNSGEIRPTERIEAKVSDEVMVAPLRDQIDQPLKVENFMTFKCEPPCLA